MEKVKQDYVEGVRLWIKAQKNLAAQLDANISYNRKEVEFHENAIENGTAMLKHYVDQIEREEAHLEKYITENSNK